MKTAFRMTCQMSPFRVVRTRGSFQMQQDLSKCLLCDWWSPENLLQKHRCEVRERRKVPTLRDRSGQRWAGPGGQQEMQMKGGRSHSKQSGTKDEKTQAGWGKPSYPGRGAHLRMHRDAGAGMCTHACLSPCAVRHACDTVLVLVQ